MIRIGSLALGGGTGRPLEAWKLAGGDRIRIETGAYDGEGTVLYTEQTGPRVAIHWAGDGNVSGCWAVDRAHEVHVVRGSLLWLR